MRLSILGGSSPFILELFEAMACAPVVELNEVLLFGRNVRALRRVAAFAAHRLGIKANWTTDAEAACDRFDVIIHQIRYGGMAGRAEDEQVAIAAGVPPDESLGPAGLASALRMQAPLLETAERIARGSPFAHVINLTNPLGLSTSLMWIGGVACPIGICELPEWTAATVATSCGIPANGMRWQYSGLNHRGFLHNFEPADVIERLAHAGMSAPFGGVSGNTLRTFGAVPTKYFQLFTRGVPISPPGRAAALTALRDTILAELDRTPFAVPPSLGQRSQPWWALSVVPLLRALASHTPSRHILNLVHPDGLCREGWCTASRDGVHWIGSPPPPEPVARWIEAFERHERLSLELLRDPSPARFEAAIAADPLNLQFKRPLPTRSETASMPALSSPACAAE
jgi:6-phospho-beta-glucosidase